MTNDRFFRLEDSQRIDVNTNFAHAAFTYCRSTSDPFLALIRALDTNPGRYSVEFPFHQNLVQFSILNFGLLDYFF